MKRAVLYDVDSRIPNLALMKISAFYRRQGWSVFLLRGRASAPPRFIAAERYFASAVFYTDTSFKRIRQLQAVYGGQLQTGGSGVSLETRLPPEMDGFFPDYALYRHTRYAVGFLTRGCNKRCAFCVVPAKEGRIKRLAQSFDDFVPAGQRNVLLLDDNLLAFSGVSELLREMIRRRYAVNFSQTLDIAYLDDEKYQLLRQVDYQSARFNNRMIYFSLNYPRTVRQFQERRAMLKGFGEDCVTAVCIYGFDTRLSEDYERFFWLRRLKIIPFFQEYWPIAGVPSRLAEDFFDMDLAPLLRLTFRSNGYNWEKYLRWLNLLYFRTFGRFYEPLIETIFRYNNKARHSWYRDRPGWLTRELYRDFRGWPPDAAPTWSDLLDKTRHRSRSPHGLIDVLRTLADAPGEPDTPPQAPAAG